MRKQRQVVRERNSCIVIKCEGDTEKVYFNNFSTRNMPIRFATGNCKDPRGMFNDLCTFLNNEDYSAKEYRDKIFLVLDTDLEEKRIKEIENLYPECKKMGIEIITSAPTFEIWFLMHFATVGAYGSSHIVKKEIKKYIPTYKEGMDVMNMLRSVDDAIRQARQQEIFAQNNGESLLKHNPHSLVYKIIENINFIQR